MGSLTVRENLQFSAALRLPGHMTASDRKQRVERVIEILNLFSCAETKVVPLLIKIMGDKVTLFIRCIHVNVSACPFYHNNV